MPIVATLLPRADGDGVHLYASGTQESLTITILLSYYLTILLLSYHFTFLPSCTILLSYHFTIYRRALSTSCASWHRSSCRLSSTWPPCSNLILTALFSPGHPPTRPTGLHYLPLARAGYWQLRPAVARRRNVTNWSSASCSATRTQRGTVRDQCAGRLCKWPLSFCCTASTTILVLSTAGPVAVQPLSHSVV